MSDPTSKKTLRIEAEHVFPEGSSAQFEFARQFEEDNPGWQVRLYDGSVKNFTTDWQWEWTTIIPANMSTTIHLDVGDTLILLEDGLHAIRKKN